MEMYSDKVMEHFQSPKKEFELLSTLLKNEGKHPSIHPL